MQNKALLVIDLQNDITRHYKDIIDNVNLAIEWAIENEVHIAYIKHEILSDTARVFRPGTSGVEFVPELSIASDNIFTKHEPSPVTCPAFMEFVESNEIAGFDLSGADATQCVKSTCFNLRKAEYDVTVLADCIASWKPALVDEMLDYYTKQGSRVDRIKDLIL
jgi:nicotinamidase-related amidase